MTPDDVLIFLQNSVGKMAVFSESYAAYDFISSTHTDGKQWIDTTALVTSVNISPMPEPSTVLLSLIGIGLIGLVSKKI